MDPLAGRIISVRQHVYPRTSYATAGAASSTLLVFGRHVQESECMQDVIQSGEFTKTEILSPSDLPKWLEKVAGHVIILFNVSDESALISAVDIVNSGKTNLIYVVLPTSAAQSLKIRLDSLTAPVEYNQRNFEQSELFSIFRRPVKAMQSEINLVSFNGQPSVQSLSQFKYLWSKRSDDSHAVKGSTVADAKMRVLQRLSDKELEVSKCKWTFAQWDNFVHTLVTSNNNDGFIYSQLRKAYLGKTLEEESESIGDVVCCANDTHEINGRDDFMAKLITECVPDRLAGRISTLLDYGCAEGGITSVVCNILNVPVEGRYGADVRNIKPSGFTFFQLPAEEENASILPDLPDSSVDVITASMVLHHVKNITAVLTELRRIVSPRGALIIREHNCESSGDAAFLDITHGLYSLSWSTPVEWPEFLAEYHASYRSKGGWNDIIQQHGFVRVEDNSKVRGHYDSQSRCKNTGNDGYGRFSNLQKAYYAVYMPVAWQKPVAIHVHVPSATSTTSSSVSASKRPDGYGDDEMQTKRLKPEPRSASSVDNSPSSALLSKEIFESSKHRGSFYIIVADGSTDWVTVDLSNNTCMSTVSGVQYSISNIHRSS
jgi:SAM-dependent methyltransferase